MFWITSSNALERIIIQIASHQSRFHFCLRSLLKFSSLDLKSHIFQHRTICIRIINLAKLRCREWFHLLSFQHRSVSQVVLVDRWEISRNSNGCHCSASDCSKIAGRSELGTSWRAFLLFFFKHFLILFYIPSIEFSCLYLQESEEGMLFIPIDIDFTE